MQFYALRLDVVSAWDLFKAAYIVWLAANADSYIVVREIVDSNDHTHAIFSSVKKVNTLRQSLKRSSIGVKGNGQYSLKACDDDHTGYLRYLMKGDAKDKAPVVVAYQGIAYGQDKFDQWHAEYWVTNATLTSQRAKRAELGGNIVEKVEALAKEKKLKAYERDCIAELYVNLYKEARKPISSFHLRTVVNTVCLLLEGGEDQVKVLCAEIHSKW